MRGEEFVEIAGKIASLDLGSAGARTAVSRAYYGAFHLAQQMIVELTGIHLKSGSAHGIVPQCLQESNEQDAVQAGRLLSDLHSERVKADYRLDDPAAETAAYARRNVERAVEIQSRIDSFRQRCLSDATATQALKERIDYVRHLRGG